MAESISPLAGKPVTQAMLVNVPRLVTAYFAQRPDPSIVSEKVSFGTSGHRGSAFERSFNRGTYSGDQPGRLSVSKKGWNRGAAFPWHGHARTVAGGVWEGLTDTEINERYPRERATWDPPNGEPTRDVADRVSAAISRVSVGVAPGQLAVVVSHGAALRLGMERLLGLPAQGKSVLGPLANCSWSVLSVLDGRWRLLEYNAGTLPEPVIGDDR